MNKDKGTAQRLFFVYKSVTSALVCDVNLENIGEYANVTWHLYMFEAAVGFTVAAALNTAIQLVFAGTAGLFGRIRMLFCETDIVWGKSEIGLEYAKKNKKTIYWVGPGQDTGKKWSYFADKVTICTLPYTEGSIKTLIKGSRRVRFIVFKGDSDTISKNLGMFYNVVSKLDEKRIKSGKEANLKVRASLYLEAENNSKEQIARFATSKNTATINDSIFCFSRHDLMANLVVSEYPITKYLDKDFIDTQNAVIQNDTRINIIYLGFGNANKSMFSVSAPLYALPTKKDNQYGPADIMYFAFDYDKTYSYGISNSFECQNYSRFLEKLPKDETEKAEELKKYYPLPPDPMANLKFSILDFKKQEAMDTLISVFKGGGVNVNTDDDGEPKVEGEADEGKKVFNFVYVSYGTDIENIDTANKILEKWERDVKGEKEKNKEKYEKEKYPFNLQIFVKVRSNLITEENKGNDKIIYYGNYAKAYSRDSIIREKIYKIAKNINASYEENKTKNPELLWKQCSPVNKESSISSAQSYRIILNMIGLDLFDSKEYITNLKEKQKKLKCKIKEQKNEILKLKNQKKTAEKQSNKSCNQKEKSNKEEIIKNIEELKIEKGKNEETLKKTRKNCQYVSGELSLNKELLKYNTKCFYSMLGINIGLDDILKHLAGINSNGDDTENFNYAPKEHFNLSESSYDLVKTLAFYEHQRWNAYEIMTGFIPMEKGCVKSELKFKVMIPAENPNEKPIEKTLTTTSKGLLDAFENYEKGKTAKDFSQDLLIICQKIQDGTAKLSSFSVVFRDKDRKHHCALTTYEGLKTLSEDMSFAATAEGAFFMSKVWENLHMDPNDKQRKQNKSEDVCKAELAAKYSLYGSEVEQYHKDYRDVLIISPLASDVNKIITKKEGNLYE